MWDGCECLGICVYLNLLNVKVWSWWVLCTGVLPFVSRTYVSSPRPLSLCFSLYVSLCLSLHLCLSLSLCLSVSLSDCDQGSYDLAEALGWKDEFEALVTREKAQFAVDKAAQEAAAAGRAAGRAAGGAEGGASGGGGGADVDDHAARLKAHFEDPFKVLDGATDGAVGAVKGEDGAVGTEDLAAQMQQMGVADNAAASNGSEGKSRLEEEGGEEASATSAAAAEPRKDIRPEEVGDMAEKRGIFALMRKKMEAKKRARAAAEAAAAVS